MKRPSTVTYNVFISYSSKDLSLTEYLKRLLSSNKVDVFVAEYSIEPGAAFADKIIGAIKECDLFLLLWSKSSKESEWVQQEIGIARGNNKSILPIVLQDGLNLPAFIRDLEYLPAYKNPSEWFTWLQQHVFGKRREKQQQTDAFVLLVLGAVLVWMARLNFSKQNSRGSLSQTL